MRAIVSFAVLVATSTPSSASPNVPLDEPLYERLTVLRARGRLPLWVDGRRPLSLHRVRALLLSAGDVPSEPALSRWWALPLRRAILHAAAVRDRERSYSTLLRPRDVTGSVSVYCEHREGRPCGDGAGIFTDLDSSAGYNAWISGSIGLRLQTGTNHYESDVSLYRAYVQSEVGLATLGLGREVITTGVASRTQLAWGGHAPPIDHIRLALTEPWMLTRMVGVSGTYVIGRPREPQTFDGNLITLARAQLDVADTVEVGVMQLLQLLGTGAPSLGVIDFVLEHVRRRDASAGHQDSSNRRFGGDVSFHIAGLHGARLYYAVMFEDIRRARFIDAVRYDADHLFGIELAGLGSKLNGVTIEWHQTGIRSHEHDPRKTGFTHGGYLVGAPLGPDSESVYLGARLSVGAATLYPWIEVVRAASDTYELTPFGGIDRTSRGEDEARYRIGVRARFPIGPDVAVATEALLEHIDDFAFQAGAMRNHVGAIASFIWHPAWRVTR